MFKNLIIIFSLFFLVFLGGFELVGFLLKGFNWYFVSVQQIGRNFLTMSNVFLSGLNIILFLIFLFLSNIIGVSSFKVVFYCVIMLTLPLGVLFLMFTCVNFLFIGKRFVSKFLRFIGLSMFVFGFFLFFCVFWAGVRGRAKIRFKRFRLRFFTELVPYLKKLPFLSFDHLTVTLLVILNAFGISIIVVLYNKFVAVFQGRLRIDILSGGLLDTIRKFDISQHEGAVILGVLGFLVVLYVLVFFYGCVRDYMIYYVDLKSRWGWSFSRVRIICVILCVTLFFILFVIGGLYFIISSVWAAEIAARSTGDWVLLSYPRLGISVTKCWWSDTELYFEVWRYLELVNAPSFVEQRALAMISYADHSAPKLDSLIDSCIDDYYTGRSLRKAVTPFYYIFVIGAGLAWVAFWVALGTNPPVNTRVRRITMERFE